MKNLFKFLSYALTATILTFVATVPFISQRVVPLIARSVLFGNPQKSYPLLSPDGTQLAYNAPLNGVMNIWVKTIGKDNDHAITHDTNRGVYIDCWAKNGKQVLYLDDTDGDENYHLYAVDSVTQEVKDFTLFEKVKAYILTLNKDYPDELLIAMNKEDPKFFDVYHLDLITGDQQLVVKNPGNISRWIAGNHMQILGALQTNNDGSQTLLVRTHNQDTWRTLLKVEFEDTLEDELYSAILGFSKDEQYLYLNSSVGMNTRSLMRVNVQTGDREIIASDPEYDVLGVGFNAKTLEPNNVSWNKEFVCEKILDPALKEDFDRILATCKGELYRTQTSDDGRKWLLGFMYDTRSFEYYLYDFDTKQSTFLFYNQPELNNYALAAMEPISFIARDGLKIHGYITYPVGKQRANLPLVLNVHGGPFFRDSWNFNAAVQLFANRGYVCLQVNFRGSAGYGKAFLAAGNKEWGGKMQDDLTDAVHWAIDQGIVHPKKIAIYGGSYGGYAALVGATCTPDLYCCAVDYCGPSSLITVLKTLPPYWSLAQWEARIGSLSDEEFLKSRSPLYKIDQIKIPLLIAHGTNDVRVKQSESDQLVAKLKEKGIEHQYMLFGDEGHGSSLPENEFKFYAALEKFLAKHLGGRYEP